MAKCHRFLSLPSYYIIMGLSRWYFWRNIFFLMRKKEASEPKRKRGGGGRRGQGRKSIYEARNERVVSGMRYSLCHPRDGPGMKPISSEGPNINQISLQSPFHRIYVYETSVFTGMCVLRTHREYTVGEEKTVELISFPLFQFGARAHRVKLSSKRKKCAPCIAVSIFIARNH